MAQLDSGFQVGCEEEEVLVRRAQAGDRAAFEVLFRRYRPVIRRLAARYFVSGGDREDLVQEAGVGFFKAVRDYRPGFLTRFSGFARMCVVRQVISAVKASTRAKHSPLNGYVSLYAAGPGADSRALFEEVADPRCLSPEELLVEKEDAAARAAALRGSLSHLERRVLELYLSEASYRTIAWVLNRSPKAVDNALARIKRKLRRGQPGRGTGPDPP